MSFYGLIWPFGILVVFYGLSWQNIDLIGLVSFFLAVIDPNPFGLVKKEKGSTVNNKKTHTPCFSTFRFSRISPEPLELQKIYLDLFVSLSKELSAEKRIFQMR